MFPIQNEKKAIKKYVIRLKYENHVIDLVIWVHITVKPKSREISLTIKLKSLCSKNVV